MIGGLTNWLDFSADGVNGSRTTDCSRMQMVIDSNLESASVLNDWKNGRPIGYAKRTGKNRRSADGVDVFLRDSTGPRRLVHDRRCDGFDGCGCS